MSAPDVLTEEQVYDRARVLASYSSFDADGILGFLHGVEIGPSPISSLRWLPVLLARLRGVEKSIVQPVVDGVVVIQSCVRDRLVQRVPLAPPEHDEARWRSFAAGYSAYAALDGAWIQNPKHWNYVVWAAVLAGRSDLLPERTQLRLAEEQETVKRELAEQKAQSIVLAYEDMVVAAPPDKIGKVSRNDPCPCGSGKKYKKCCLTSGTIV